MPKQNSIPEMCTMASQSDMTAAPRMSDDYVWFGILLLGPHPITQEPNSWFYTRTDPPTPLSPEDNERAEKLAAEVFNRPFSKEVSTP